MLVYLEWSTALSALSIAIRVRAHHIQLHLVEKLRAHLHLGERNELCWHDDCAAGCACEGTIIVALSPVLVDADVAGEVSAHRVTDWVMRY
jgi:hypothetical protein